MIRALSFQVAFYVVTAAFLILGSPLLLGPRRWAMKGLELHARACCWLLGAIVGTRMEVRGRENIPAGACLIVAKHQSAWDTFALVPLFRDPAIVLKDELKWIPLYGWFCLKFKHILVKRGRAAAALKAMIADAQTKTADGRQVLIFPEGTRRQPGDDPAYKPGYIALYEALGVPCVPLALNSGLYWPRRSLARYPGTIVVEFLPAIAPGLSRREFKVQVEEGIEAASRRLIRDAAASAQPPPLPETASRHMVS